MHETDGPDMRVEVFAWTPNIGGTIQMTHMKTEGKVDQAKGSVKEAAGKITGKKSTELKGKAEKAKGKVKEKLG
jgi:uncharacterized protein YjbJ (UPF0337 family)